LDAVLSEGEPEAAGVVEAAIEEFSKELALVIRRYLKTKGWKDTERIVIGGGFRGSRVGELVIGRTAVLLKTEKIDVDLVPVRNDPNEAGLLGATQLVPKWLFQGQEAILAVDIGGTNIRAGLIALNVKKVADLSKAAVQKLELWGHADKRKVGREAAVKTLTKMLQKLIARAKKERLALAPFIGIGCPGIINKDGSMERGAQNLPGDWESSDFHLPSAINKIVPKIGDDETVIVMHNDAVVQGLSETPYMGDVKRWGVLTIGTGLGNARFTNHRTT
jgi:ROK family